MYYLRNNSESAVCGQNLTFPLIADIYETTVSPLVFKWGIFTFSAKDTRALLLALGPQVITTNVKFSQSDICLKRIPDLFFVPSHIFKKRLYCD